MIRFDHPSLFEEISVRKLSPVEQLHQLLNALRRRFADPAAGKVFFLKLVIKPGDSCHIGFGFHPAFDFKGIYSQIQQILKYGKAFPVLQIHQVPGFFSKRRQGAGIFHPAGLGTGAPVAAAAAVEGA